MVFERSGGEPVPGDPFGDGFDDRFLDTPNCSVCLSRMDAEESAAGTPFWACSTCGATRVA